MEPAIQRLLLTLRENLIARRLKAGGESGSNPKEQEEIAICDQRLERITNYPSHPAVLCPVCWVDTGKKIHMQPVLASMFDDGDLADDDTDDLDELAPVDETYECTLCKTTLNLAP